MNYKVSVIIPMYNNEKHIKQCINSIVNQTIFGDVQIIVIDDGSTDSSIHILSNFKIFPNIQLIQKTNEGSGIARNIGIQVASGQYLMFVDGDDYLYENDVIEVLYNTAISKSVVLCGGNYVNLHGKIMSYTFPKQRKKLSMNYEGFITADDFQFPYGHQRFIFNRNFILDNSIKYSEYLRGQDVTFLADVLSKLEKLYYINKSVYVHRIGHKTNKLSRQKAIDLMKSFFYVFKLAMKKNWENIVSNINIEMRSLGIKSIYSVLTDEDWDLINDINSEIKQWNYTHNEKLKYLLTQKEYISKKITYWTEWANIGFLGIVNKSELAIAITNNPSKLSKSLS